MLSAGLLATFGACRATSSVATGMNLSSALSEYSPSVRLAVEIPLRVVSLDRRATNIVVRVDSGFVRAYGVFAGNGLVVTRDLRISAILAAFPSAEPERRNSTTPWTGLAHSADQPLVDSLRYGEARALSPMTFVISTQHEGLRGANGVVFEITGEAVTTPLRLATGGLLPARTMGKGSIRVFACSPFRLDGSVDTHRQKHLDTRYVEVCKSCI
jgi:hypothetical protein